MGIVSTNELKDVAIVGIAVTIVGLVFMLAVLIYMLETNQPARIFLWYFLRLSK